MVNGVSHAELDFPSICTKAPAGFDVNRISTLPATDAGSGACSAGFFTGVLPGAFVSDAGVTEGLESAFCAGPADVCGGFVGCGFGTVVAACWAGSEGFCAI